VSKKFGAFKNSVILDCGCMVKFYGEQPVMVSCSNHNRIDPNLWDILISKARELRSMWDRLLDPDDVTVCRREL
jgi:hypothetical protein